MKNILSLVVLALSVALVGCGERPSSDANARSGDVKEGGKGLINNQKNTCVNSPFAQSQDSPLGTTLPPFPTKIKKVTLNYFVRDIMANSNPVAGELSVIHKVSTSANGLDLVLTHRFPNTCIFATGKTKF